MKIIATPVPPIGSIAREVDEMLGTSIASLPEDEQLQAMCRTIEGVVSCPVILVPSLEDQAPIEEAAPFEISSAPSLR